MAFSQILLLSLLAVAATASSSSEFCRADDCGSSKNDDKKYADNNNDNAWHSLLRSELAAEVEKLEALVEQDEDRTKVLLEALSGKDPSNPTGARDAFHRSTALTLQTHCLLGKRVGARWEPQCGYTVGDSFVCLDGLLSDEAAGRECLVYSFAVGKRVRPDAVEAALGKSGCKVRILDPLIKEEEDGVEVSENVSRHRFALAENSGEIKVRVPQKKKGSSKSGNKNNKPSFKTVTVPALTLQDAVIKLGDEGKSIAYLKLDAEGAEIAAFQHLINEDKAFGKVKQLSVTFHTGQDFLPPTNDESVGNAALFYNLTSSLQKLHLDRGFRLVHYAPDGCLARGGDGRRGVYYTNFDAVWVKS